MDVDSLNVLYEGRMTSDKMNKIKEHYLKQLDENVKIVCEDRYQFLSWIGTNVTSRNSASMYTNDIINIKYLVANFEKDNLPEILKQLILSKNIKHYMIIQMLRALNRKDRLNLYKRNVVEPLVASAIRLVYKLVNEVPVRMSYNDKIMAGMEGLIEAAWRFEPDKDFQFTTYARHWIRCKLFNAIKEHMPVKVPNGTMVKFASYNTLYQQFIKEYETTDVDLFIEWLKTEHNIKDADKIKQILSVVNTISFEQLTENYENRSSDEIVGDDKAMYESSDFSNFVENFENNEFMQQFINIAKNILDSVELRLFIDYYINNIDISRLCEITKLNKRKVRRILDRAKLKLKKAFKTKDNLLTLTLPEQKSKQVIESFF